MERLGELNEEVILNQGMGQFRGIKQRMVRHRLKVRVPLPYLDLRTMGEHCSRT